MIFYLAAASLVVSSIVFYLYCKITRSYFVDNNNMQLVFVMFFIVPFFVAILILPISHSTINQTINSYNNIVEEVNIIESFDCNLSNRDFVNYLHNFIHLENEIKDLKDDNKSVWISIYVPDKIDDVELVGQSVILNKCKKESKSLHVEDCESTIQTKGEPNGL